MIITAIYSPDHTRPKVREHSLEVDDITVHSALQTAYRQFNHVDGEEHVSSIPGERSLSVGDAVRIDGKTYVCAFLGWKLVDDAALKAIQETRFDRRVIGSCWLSLPGVLDATFENE